MTGEFAGVGCARSLAWSSSEGVSVEGVDRSKEPGTVGGEATTVWEPDDDETLEPASGREVTLSTASGLRLWLNLLSVRSRPRPPFRFDRSRSRSRSPPPRPLALYAEPIPSGERLPIGELWFERDRSRSEKDEEVVLDLPRDDDDDSGGIDPRPR